MVEVFRAFRGRAEPVEVAAFGCGQCGDQFAAQVHEAVRRGDAGRAGRACADRFAAFLPRLAIDVVAAEQELRDRAGPSFCSDRYAATSFCLRVFTFANSSRSLCLGQGEIVLAGVVDERLLQRGLAFECIAERAR